MTKNEFRPCPFCGSTNVDIGIISDKSRDNNYLIYNAVVRCYSCNVSMDIDNPDVKKHTSWDKAVKFAYDAWNKRAYEL